MPVAASKFRKESRSESDERTDITELSRTERLSSVLSANNEVGICWIHPPDVPWSLHYYLTENGISNMYVYWWITKDLAWAQAWYWIAHIFGALSLAWQSYILYKATQRRNVEDIWINITFTLWLFGHYWWMDGDLHDIKYPNESPIYNERTRQTGYIFIVASIWVSMYYLLLKPFNLLGAHPRGANSLAAGQLNWRLPSYFKSWKEYENAHSLFWILKDTGWNLWIPPMVAIFFFPTFILAVDFVWITLHVKHGLIDHSHYCAGLLWLCAASTWAAGEFYFTPNHNKSVDMTDWTSEAKITSRWYASWLLAVAYVPIVVLYAIWLPSTYCGRIHGVDRKPSAYFRLINPLLLDQSDDDETEKDAC